MSAAAALADVFGSELASGQRELIVRTLCRRLQDAQDDGAESLGVARLLVTLIAAGPSSVSEEVFEHACSSLCAYILLVTSHASSSAVTLGEVVRLCTQLYALKLRVDEVCLRSLGAEVERLVADGFSQTLVPARDVLSYAQDTASNPSSTTVPAQEDRNATLSGSLSYFHTCALLCVPFLPQHQHLVIRLLLLLLATPDAEVYARVKDTLLPIIKSLPPESTPTVNSESMQSIQLMLWPSLRSLTANPQRSSGGFMLWAVTVNSPSQLLHDRLYSDEYWKAIHKGLCVGTTDTRKYCLAILQSSLRNLDRDCNVPHMQYRQSEKQLYATQYAKFAVLFETIALGRYLNQVQESLHDLTSLLGPNSKVGSRWIVALLEASLAHGMQDSIRNIMGSWTLSHSLPVLSAAGNATNNFLINAFLSWAAVGSLYNSFTRGDSERSVECRHGENLSRFICRLVSSAEDRLGVVRSVLTFIVDQGNRMLPFARAFMLGGIVESLQQHRVELDATSLALVLKVAAVQGFQGMVQDLMTMYCATLSSYSSLELQQSHNLRPLHLAARLVENPQKKLKDESDDELWNCLSRSIPPSSTNGNTAPHETPTVARLFSLLQTTNCTCLAGSNLAIAIEYIVRALENTSFAAIAPSEITTIVEAVWDEVEVQEYPKRVMMTLPYFLFHPKLVNLCETESRLSSVLTNLVTTLLKLAEHRIYIFAPLAESLRRAFLHIDAAECLPFHDYIIRYANAPPSTRTEFELERSISSRLTGFAASRTYESYYGKHEAYGHACVFDTLNRLSFTGYWTTQCRTILDELLGIWLRQKRPPPVFSKWKTSGQLQIMLISMERILPSLSELEVKGYVEKFFELVALEPLPRFRYLLEWTLVRIFTRVPHLRNIVLEVEECMDLSNPKFLVSIIKLNFMLSCLPDSTEEFVQQHMAQLVTLCASAKIAIRHEAQWTFAPLWDHVVSRGWTSMTENPAFSRMNAYIRGLEAYKNPPPGRLLERFDPTEDHNMTHLFQGDHLKIEPGEAEILGYEDLLAVCEDDGQLLPVIPVGDPVPGRIKNPGLAKASAQSMSSLPTREITVAPLQIKASSWQEDLAMLPGAAKTSRRFHDIIVIASFIENAYNIGGLSRVGEIFGIKSLQIRTLKTLLSKDFTSVSVSSHMWLPIEQLAVDDVSQYITDRKVDGYSAVGIEQTDSSKILGQSECKLPEKIVLVLGSEREGIPARILAEMDFCVEIKQAGITRSLNVQTAAAVALYEYRRQHKITST